MAIQFQGFFNIGTWKWRQGLRGPCSWWHFVAGAHRPVLLGRASTWRSPGRRRLSWGCDPRKEPFKISEVLNWLAIKSPRWCESDGFGMFLSLLLNSVETLHLWPLSPSLGLHEKTVSRHMSALLCPIPRVVLWWIPTVDMPTNLFHSLSFMVEMWVQGCFAWHVKPDDVFLLHLRGQNVKPFLHLNLASQLTTEFKLLLMPWSGISQRPILVL